MIGVATLRKYGYRRSMAAKIPEITPADPTRPVFTDLIPLNGFYENFPPPARRRGAQASIRKSLPSMRARNCLS